MTETSGRWTENRKGGVLPRLVLIADGFATGSEALAGEDVRERALEAVGAGRLWLHLRDHGASAEAFARTARELAECVREVRPGTLVSVNTHIGTAQALGAGIHVGTRGPSVAEARRQVADGPVSCAAHTADEARAAVAQGADAVLFSPVFPTDSKPGHPGVGLDTLAACCSAIPDTPVYALGGISPKRVVACQAAGGYGVAVLSGILHADDPAAATARFLNELQP